MVGGIGGVEIDMVGVLKWVGVLVLDRKCGGLSPPILKSFGLLKENSITGCFDLSGQVRPRREIFFPQNK